MKLRYNAIGEITSGRNAGWYVKFIDTEIIQVDFTSMNLRIQMAMKVLILGLKTKVTLRALSMNQIGKLNGLTKTKN